MAGKSDQILKQDQVNHCYEKVNRELNFVCIRVRMDVNYNIACSAVVHRCHQPLPSIKILHSHLHNHHLLANEYYHCPEFFFSFAGAEA